MQKYPQIYAEAECNANLFAIAEAQPYKSRYANRQIFRMVSGRVSGGYAPEMLVVWGCGGRCSETQR